MKTFIKEEIKALNANIELVQNSFCTEGRERFLPVLQEAKKILETEDEIIKNNVIAFHLPQIYCAMGF